MVAALRAQRKRKSLACFGGGVVEGFKDHSRLGDGEACLDRTDRPEAAQRDDQRTAVGGRSRTANH